MQDNGGERELVLGNKQLLTIFFVASLLCGVFFAVGYVVGGNSAKSTGSVPAADSGTAPTSDGKREEPQQTDTTASSVPASSGDAGGTLPGPEPHMADNPAASGSIPTSAAPIATAPAPAQPAPSVPVAKAPATVAGSSVATGIFVSVPETGAWYVQVIATPRPHADDLVKSLRETRLPAILAESSKPELFEVLVGPYRSPITLADAKRKLTDLGFNGLIVHKW